MELRLHDIIHLYNVFHENDGKENCAQLIEEGFYKIFDKKSLNDEHDCTVVSTISLNIHSTNDDCTSHDENVSYILECIEFAGTHQIGKIDFARGISIWKLNGCKKG